jgi:branched-subunit amino acid aminotransferase/4-amino-4-deoxychorismate lyase
MMADDVVNDGRVQSDVRAEQAAAAAEQGDGLDGLTKDELLQEAEDRGVEVKTSATKAEILAALRG